MNRHSFRVLVLAACGLLASAVQAAPPDGYDQMKKKFDALVKKSQDHARSGRHKFETVRAGRSNIKVMKSGRFDPLEGQALKIWFERVEPGKTTGTGEFVNFIKHEWQPKERFFIWFETSAPVQIALDQVYEDGSQEPRHVLPQERFPNSLATIEPGKPRRFDVLMELDDDAKPETMQVLMKFAGEIGDESKTGQEDVDSPLVDAEANVSDPASGDEAKTEVGSSGPGGSMKSRWLKNSARISRAIAKDPKLKRKLRSSEIATNDQPTDPLVSSEPDEVAGLAYTPSPTGVVEIKLTKKPAEAATPQ